MYQYDGRITIDNRAFLETYLNGYYYKSSGMTFTSLFMWRNVNCFSWRMFGDYLCIAGVDNLQADCSRTFLFPPLTDNCTYDPASLRKTIYAARESFESKGIPFVMMLVPFHMLEVLESALPGELEYIPDRPNFDYVYNTKDLIDLHGHDFHAKRNHINYFLKHYDYEYSKLDESMAEEALLFIREFNERKNPANPHERELLLMEEEAMRDVFYNLSAVGYLTGAIHIDGKLQALSIGGRLGNKTVIVHVEKANVEYRGLYQLINNEFCKHMAAHVKRINREEDMGLPGLRKAKLSYNPIKMIEKYTVRFKHSV